jgi:hypothetical protein
MAALRAFLLSVLPVGWEVIRAQDNRVPAPIGPNYVVMTPTLRERLATNIDTFTDAFPLLPQQRSALQPVQVTTQLDVHGPAGADAVHLITTLFRDYYCADLFTELLAGSGFTAAPLYCGQPHQMPFTNDQQQAENRWILDAVMQVNPVVIVDQAFASTLGRPAGV